MAGSSRASPQFALSEIPNRQERLKLAKPIIVSLGGAESTFSFTKLDRSKLYGTRRRIVLGPDGEPCQRAQLTEDGSLLLRSGMTSQGYFDDSGNLISQSDFVGISAGFRTDSRNSKIITFQHNKF